MKYQESVDYPLTPEQLLKAFTAPHFVVDKYTQQGASHIEVLAQSQEANDWKITVQRQVPVEIDVPAFARSLVPARITLLQTDRWNLSTGRGSLTIDFVNMPVKIYCQMSLSATPAGVQHRLAFDLKVGVPLIGGKLEAILAQDLQLKSKADNLVTIRMLQAAGLMS